MATILRRHWETRIPTSARRISGGAGVDPRTWLAAVEAFEALRYEVSPSTHSSMTPIVCTGGRLFRQKSSRPLYLLHYRSVIGIMRETRADGKRGTLVLFGVLPRDPNTYEPTRLRQMVQDAIAEAKKAEETVKA